MAERSEVSDQLPEEAPAGDEPGADEGAAREAAQRQAREANRSGHSPGDSREPGDGRRS